MTNAIKVAVVGLLLITTCFGEESLVAVSNKGKQEWPAQEVDKIYLLACAAVQREFDNKHSLRPRVTLVLGADQNGVEFNKGQVLLVRWDRELFAQGVVLLAFEDLMPVQQRMTIARRALNWADATIDVAQIDSSRWKEGKESH